MSEASNSGGDEGGIGLEDSGSDAVVVEVAVLPPNLCIRFRRAFVG